MNESFYEPLALERILARCKEQLHAFRVPLLSALISGVLAYCFCFTNKLVNHDEVYSLFYKGTTLSSGRWMLSILDCIFPNISMPWIYGILTIVLISLAICLLVSLFNLQNRLLQGVLAGVVMVFPSLIGLFSYMFTSSCFALSFLLAVSAVWFGANHTWRGRGICLVCLILSMGIYQSYISVAASLMVLLLIQELLKGEDVAAVIRHGVEYVVLLLLSMIVYYGITQALLSLAHMALNDYANSNLAFDVGSLPAKVLTAYHRFFSILWHNLHSLVVNGFSRLIHMVMLAVTTLLLLIWALTSPRKERMRFLLLGLLLFLLPLSINSIYLLAEDYAVHSLVLYSFVSLYVLAVMVADHMLQQNPANFKRRLIRLGANLTALALIGILIVNTYAANAAYVGMYLRYENTYAFYSSLMAQLKTDPDFDADSKLAVLGKYHAPDFYEKNLGAVSAITGCGSLHPSCYSWNRFLTYYMGFPIEAASDEEVQEIMASDIYAQMPIYPYYGSVQKIGNVYVVKLSE